MQIYYFKSSTKVHAKKFKRNCKGSAPYNKHIGITVLCGGGVLYGHFNSTVSFHKKIAFPSFIPLIRIMVI